MKQFVNLSRYLILWMSLFSLVSFTQAAENKLIKCMMSELQAGQVPIHRLLIPEEILNRFIPVFKQADSSFSFFTALDFMAKSGQRYGLIPALLESNFAKRNKFTAEHLNELLDKVNRELAFEQINPPAIKQAADELWPKLKNKSLSKGQYDNEIQIGSIKDQCDWGGCWAFSSTSMLEMELSAKLKKPVELSGNFMFLNHLITSYGNAFDGSMDMDLSVVNPKNIITEGLSTQDSRQYLDLIGVIPKTAWIDKFEANGIEIQKVRTIMKEILIKNQIQYKKANNLKDKALIKSQYLHEMVTALYNLYGRPPEQFVFEGKTYTPKSFAQEFFPKEERHFIGLRLNPQNGESSLFEKWSQKYKVLDPSTLTWKEIEHQGVQKMASFSDVSNFIIANVKRNRPMVLSYQHVPGHQGEIYVNQTTGVMSAPAKTPNDISYEKTGMHAMVIVGYESDIDGNIVKLKLINSHGLELGDQGVYHMDVNYFRNFAQSIDLY